MIAETSPLDTLLQRLHGVRCTGNGFMALCPAHEDRTPSLSVTVTPDGTILLHCFADCSTDAVLNACGLSFRDLFGSGEGGVPEALFQAKRRPRSVRMRRTRERPRHTPAHLAPHTSQAADLSRSSLIAFPSTPAGRVARHKADVTPWACIETYTYTDEKGRFLFAVDRLERMIASKDAPGEARRQKRFCQWHIAPDGRRINNVQGCRMVLYMLPDVVSAIGQGMPIVIVEGEKDADTANLYFRHEIGSYVATTNPGGAGAWRMEYTETLRNAEVILCGDADAAGHEYMRELAFHLRNRVKRLRALDIRTLLVGGDHGTE